jgi:hypothetical protein
MKLLGHLIPIVFLFAGGATATTIPNAPLCVPGASLASYIDAGACRVEGSPFTLDRFGFDSSSEGDPELADPVNIFVTPSFANDIVNVSFESEFFNVTSGQSATYFLVFTIDPPPPIIRGFFDEMDTETPTNGGLAQIVTDLCIGAPLGSANCPGGTAQLRVFHDSVNFDLFDQVFFAEPTNILGVMHEITLDACLASPNGNCTAGPNATADFRALHNGALLSPEPVSMVLMASGLLALGLLRARRRS